MVFKLAFEVPFTLQRGASGVRTAQTLHPAQHWAPAWKCGRRWPWGSNSRLKTISLCFRSSCQVSGNLLPVNYLCLGKAYLSLLLTLSTGTEQETVYSYFLVMIDLLKFTGVSRCFQMGRKGRLSRCTRVLCILKWFGALGFIWQLLPHLYPSSVPYREQGGVMPWSSILWIRAGPSPLLVPAHVRCTARAT